MVCNLGKIRDSVWVCSVGKIGKRVFFKEDLEGRVCFLE